MNYTSDPAIDGVIAALKAYKNAYAPTIAIRCLEALKAERNAMRCDSAGRPLYMKLLEKMREKNLDQVTARDAHRLMQSDARRMVREGAAHSEMDVVRAILGHAKDDWLLQLMPKADRHGPGRKPARVWRMRIGGAK